MKTVDDLMKISYECYDYTEDCGNSYVCCYMHAIADDMIARGEY